MRLADRLKKMESKAPAKKKVLVVKYGNGLKELSCGGEVFCRNVNESEREFVKRIIAIVGQRPEKKNPVILVGNF